MYLESFSKLISYFSIKTQDKIKSYNTFLKVWHDTSHILFVGCLKRQPLYVTSKTIHCRGEYLVMLNMYGTQVIRE